MMMKALLMKKEKMMSSIEVTSPESALAGVLEKMSEWCLLGKKKLEAADARDMKIKEKIASAGRSKLKIAIMVADILLGGCFAVLGFIAALGLAAVAVSAWSALAATLCILCVKKILLRSMDQS